MMPINEKLVIFVFKRPLRNSANSIKENFGFNDEIKVTLSSSGNLNQHKEANQFEAIGIRIYR